MSWPPVRGGGGDRRAASSPPPPSAPCRRDRSLVAATRTSCRGRLNQRTKTRIGIGERDDTAADRLEPGRVRSRPMHSISAPRTTSRQPLPCTSSNRRPPSLPCTNCVPAWGAVGWMNPAVRSGSPGAGAGSSPTPAAMASSRAAASAGSGTQITLPELHGEVDRRPRARQPLGLVGVEQFARRRLSASTRSSFQARLAASRRPEHMP